MLRPTCDFQPLEQFMTRDVTFHAVLQSLRLGLFDTLEKGPYTAEQIALMYGFLPEPTEALLDLLATHNLLARNGDGYKNAPLVSEYLVSGSTFFQGTAMELNNRFSQYIVSEFMPLLKGESQGRERTDDDWGNADTMRGTLQYAILGGLQDTVAFIADLPGFQSFRTMADIGGNHGEYSMALLELNPNLRSTVWDLPGVVETAEEHIAERGFSDRVTVRPCDLRTERLPAGEYDLVLASHVLYGFMDDLPGFLGTIHDALKSGGWFVAQHMNPASNMPPEQKCSLEFVTRMVGYRTHFIPCDQLESAMGAAGFQNFRTGAAGRNQCGLIVAGQRT